MGFDWGQSHDDYKEVYEKAGGYDEPKHDAKLSHELLAGAAAFAGFHEFEKHQKEQGKPVKHELAKELLAGFAAAEVDKLVETRGRDEWDAHRAREQAKKNSEELYDQYHGQYDQYEPNRPHEKVKEHHHHRHGEEW